MFVHSNGKINVFANTRCGSTALGVFFGINKNFSDRIHGIKEWEELPGKKVLILRNPYDRVISAYKTLLNLGEKERLDRIKAQRKTFFFDHSHPYLYMIQHYDFSIVLFENLLNYVPLIDSYQSNTSNVSNGTYIKNPDYSAEDLEHEYLLYETYKSEREILDVESWNMLCER
jgi:hypothetical protein